MKHIVILIAIFLAACQQLPVNPPATAGKFNAACLPHAQLMCKALRAEGLPAEVLLMEFSNARSGHAVVPYRFQGRTYVWDESAWTFDTSASFTDPTRLAYAWKFNTKSRNLIRYSYFLDHD